MDTARLKDSWNAIAAHGDQVPLFFYSTLFLAHPETRGVHERGDEEQAARCEGGGNPFDGRIECGLND